MRPGPRRSWLVAVTVCLAASTCGRIRTQARADVEAALRTGRLTRADRTLGYWLAIAPKDTAALALKIRLLCIEQRLDAALHTYLNYQQTTRQHMVESLREILLAALRSSDDRILSQALAVSGEFDIRCAHAAVYRATRDRHPFVRGRAYRAIAGFRDRDAVVEMYEGCLDSDPHVRTEALMATGRRRDTASLGLTVLSTYDPIDYNRWLAVLARARLGDKKMIPHVLGHLRPECDILTVQAAACLVEIGRPKYLVRVLEGLQALSPTTRFEAVSNLCDLRQSEYLPAIKALAGDTSALVRLAVAAGLARMGHPDGRLPLLGLTCDEDPQVRSAAAIALPKLLGDHADTSLTRMLADSVVAVGVSAAGSLLGMLDAVAAEPSEPD